ncbi:E3 ubiquitin-protein ligase NRDP1 [Mactra antiquata]
MAQHSMDQEFQHLSIHDQRNPGVQMPTYRSGPAPYRSYNESKDDFLPPPPPPTSSYMDHNFPPPPPETKENIYHEIRDEDFPPPPPSGTDSLYNRSGYPQYSSPLSSYESRHESQTLVQPSGRYEREVKQATYSIQSSDSSGRSSPRSSPYASHYGIQTNAYSTSPVPQHSSTYGTPQTYSTSAPYGQYSSSNLRSGSPVRYSAGSPRQQEESGVTYAQIAPRSESGVTYAQIAPRSDRPVPGPQVPIQITVSDPKSQYSPSSNPAQSQYSRPVQLQQSSMSPRGGDSRASHSKEQEVDALTQMLMQGLEGTKDPDFFGICSKCGKKVVGESNGCTAMDQVFHIACFICVCCGTLLRGKSFYAMERKPHCESCYLNTLEKCSICSKPITDRLLRATGKPYHPACFTCVVCGKSLDGVPFTVDATNQIHCIADFHRKFAPRCCVCMKPIMPEQGQEETVRVVAMDRSFHVHCYRCEDCGELLSSEAEGRGCYPLDDHILCKTCNAKRINALTTKLSTEL